MAKTDDSELRVVYMAEGAIAKFVSAWVVDKLELNLLEPDMR